MENLNANPDTFRIAGEMAAPGVFLAFAVLHLNYRKIRLQVLGQSRLVFRAAHDPPSLETLK